MIGHSPLGKTAFGRGKAVNATLGLLMPSDVESAKLGEEMQAAVRQMIMNPPSKGRPRTALFHVIGFVAQSQSAELVTSRHE